MLVQLIGDMHGCACRERSDAVFDHSAEANCSVERDDVDVRMTVDVPLDRDVALGSDEGGRTLIYVLTDVDCGPCGKSCLTVIVDLRADVDLARGRGNRCLGVLVDRLTNRHVAAGDNLND